MLGFWHHRLKTFAWGATHHRRTTAHHHADFVAKSLLQQGLQGQEQKTSDPVGVLESCLWDRDDISGKPDYKKRT
ncbi:hypothetical protein NHP190003_15420 [Helicobacter sp. NHP19-003]|uniref:Uncharacterized protein n=1 Tax=Helicobacter gastrocanis TaxID=2849641 RepID=A0ABM7SF76_9HELI|nr:hypothetical protein NHP190003_15420 [Helicobacter sp. NHP19-003]